MKRGRSTSYKGKGALVKVKEARKSLFYIGQLSEVKGALIKSEKRQFSYLTRGTYENLCVCVCMCELGCVDEGGGNLFNGEGGGGGGGIDKQIISSIL